MKSTKEQIAKIQARQPSQSCGPLDKRNTETNPNNFNRNTPTNAHYMTGAIPSGNNVKTTASKVLKGK
jgi:hypothetical protein